MSMIVRVLNGIAFSATLFLLVLNPAFAAPPKPCAVCGAPGPIAGAGLPVLAIGGGVYWLVRRLRRKPN